MREEISLCDLCTKTKRRAAHVCGACSKDACSKHAQLLGLGIGSLAVNVLTLCSNCSGLVDPQMLRDLIQDLSKPLLDRLTVSLAERALTRDTAAPIYLSAMTMSMSFGSFGGAAHASPLSPGSPLTFTNKASTAPSLPPAFGAGTFTNIPPVHEDDDENDFDNDDDD